jgi:hypothetical protein
VIAVVAYNLLLVQTKASEGDKVNLLDCEERRRRKMWNLRHQRNIPTINWKN